VADDEQDNPLDPTDPYERQAQTFPRLTVEQIERVGRFGEAGDYPTGTQLFQRGDRSADFFVVVEGSVEITDAGTDGGEETIHLHESRQFTGELDLFNNREILVSGRTASDSRLIRVPRQVFPRLIEAEPDIGEIIMRAFILRRVGLMRHAQGGVVLIGSSHGGDTLRIQRFLSRNGYPHRMLDTEADPDAEGFLGCLQIAHGELPVVVLPGHSFLRNPSTPELADALGLTETFDPDRVYDLTVVGAGPAGLAAGRVRRFGGARHAGDRAARAGRTGRDQFQDRELSRFPDRHLRRSPGGARPGPGAEIRGKACHLAPRGGDPMRSQFLGDRA
jgi:thioredoxin reductase (NADPH)